MMSRQSSSENVKATDQPMFHVVGKTVFGAKGAVKKTFMTRSEAKAECYILSGGKPRTVKD